MGYQNKSLRGTAIPFQGQVVSYDRNELSDQDITKANDLGDLKFLAEWTDGVFFVVPQQNNMIRILTPRYAQIVEAYLSVSLSRDVLEPPATAYHQITVGTPFSGPSSVSEGWSPETPEQPTIDELHNRITGGQSLIATPGLPIAVERLNITEFIPQSGDDAFREGMFIIGIHFPTEPLYGTGFKLLQFNVEMSAIVRRD